MNDPVVLHRSAIATYRYMTLNERQPHRAMML